MLRNSVERLLMDKITYLWECLSLSDVLHVSCAEKFLLAYPPHTAPDGFFCPACHNPFLPPDVAVSPVADQLRVALNGMKDLQKR